MNQNGIYKKSNYLIVKITITWLQCCQRNHRANDALHLAILELQTVVVLHIMRFWMRTLLIYVE